LQALKPLAKQQPQIWLKRNAFIACLHHHYHMAEKASPELWTSWSRGKPKGLTMSTRDSDSLGLIINTMSHPESVNRQLAARLASSILADARIAEAIVRNLERLVAKDQTPVIKSETIRALRDFVQFVYHQPDVSIDN